MVISTKKWLISVNPESAFLVFGIQKWHEITRDFAQSDNWADKIFSEAWKPVMARVLKIAMMVTSTISDRFQYYWNLSFFFLSQYFSGIRDFCDFSYRLTQTHKKAVQNDFWADNWADTFLMTLVENALIVDKGWESCSRKMTIEHWDVGDETYC